MLRAWVTETLPRTTCHVGAESEREFGILYESWFGLIALLHRLGMKRRLPKAMSRKLDPAKQAAFIKVYETLLNRPEADETVVFADVLHPTYAVRPIGCGAPKDTLVAVAQTRGRQHLNIQDAMELETRTASMIEAETIDNQHD